jgi:hypothetical protein
MITAHQRLFMRTFAFIAFLSAAVVSSHANAMTYGLVPLQDGSAALVAQGQIGGNETSRFLSALQAAQARGTMPQRLIISSPGGNLEGALDLGQAVRQFGLRTLVGSVAQGANGQMLLTSGSCHSACVMVLMAGTSRSVLPGSRVGVHSPQIVVVTGGRGYRVDENTTRYMVQQSEPALRAYARYMGVSPAVIDVAHQVPHTSIRTLSSSELARLGLVTSGSRQKATRKASVRRTATTPATKRG